MGVLFFDETTKTKTVDSLLGKVHGPPAGMLSFLFHDLIDTPKTTDAVVAARRRETMADQLAECIKTGSGRSEKSSVVIVTAVTALVEYGWMVEKERRPLAVPLSDETRKIFREKLMAVTADLIGAGCERIRGPYHLAIPDLYHLHGAS